jgi:hypothetical protein
MDTLSTQLFRFITPCDAESVWSFLTPRHPSRGHYYGAPVLSEWEVGSTIRIGLRGEGGPAIVGEVLAAEQGVRLSHTLGDRLDKPTAYVTWTLHPSELDQGGTIVRLYVDEVDSDEALDGGDDGRAAEAAWLPVLAALQAELDRCVR